MARAILSQIHPGAGVLTALSFLAGVLRTQPVLALDPPHSVSNSIACASCHIAHHAAAGDRRTVAGNANLCLSCHIPGGPASAKSHLDSDQALPWPGLPAGMTATGTSHRWDSGLAGHVAFLGGAPTNSSGTVQSGGDYTGRVAKTYSITITQTGGAGTARFNWSGSPPGGGSGANLVCGTGVALDQGVSVTFTDGPASPSFRIGDLWNVYVRSDISQPANPLLQVAISDGR